MPCTCTQRRLFAAQYLSFDQDGVFPGNPNRGKVSRYQTPLLPAPAVACTCKHPRSRPTPASPPRVQKPPVKVLSRLESLGVLTSLSEAGLLSGAESAGLFSKLEAAGAFSAAEKLLPLADKLNVFSLLESLLLIDSSALLLGAVALLVGEVGLITVLPDDNTALVAVQAVTGVAAGAGALTLFAASALFGTLQAKN